MLSKRLAKFFNIKVWFDFLRDKANSNNLIFISYPKPKIVFITIGIGSEPINFISNE